MKKFSLISFAVLALLINSITLCLGAPLILNSITDKHSLLSFKNSLTSNVHATLSTNWSETTSVCNWIGVTCGIKHRRVTALNLPGFHLAGSVAPHLGNLTFLIYLDIGFNSFTGFLPFEISKLCRLKVMNVGVNSFTGEIPTWLGNLPQLEKLYLCNNTFSGMIPPSLFNNSELQILDMSFNLLGGNIPKEIGKSSLLKDSRITYNQLSGNIPEEISNISSLQLLNLRSNDLSGSIPHGIFNLSSVREIRLSKNSLSGWLPTDMCNNNMLNIRFLTVSWNEVKGQIPPNIWKCRDLEILSLSWNNFSGNIPIEIGSLCMLRELYLGYNHFRGGLLVEIGNLSRLEILHIDNASLTGKFPSSIFNISSLTGLSSSHNSLSGELPQDIGTVPNLQYFSVSGNSISGSISPSIFNISSLKGLAFSMNEFAGTLPSDLGHSLFNLDQLYLSCNQLNGPIPTSIINASKLTILEMALNSFTGSIPDFGNLRLLQSLRLWGNNLRGAESPTQELTFLSSLTNSPYLKNLQVSDNPLNGILPPYLGNLSSSLEYFYAQNCNIRGLIPSEIGNLSSLLDLYLDDNQLSGPIPPAIGKLKKLQRLYLRNNQLVGSVPIDLCGMNNLGDLRFATNMLYGQIPECLGEVKSLRIIDLSSNQLNSTISPNFFTLTYLLSLNLSSNNFTGQLSSQIGNLKTINSLDLSYNLFSGDIPTLIDGCQSLETLNLSNNFLSGSFPKSLGNVRGLMALDLSCNNLSGSIPKSFEGLKFLEYFNVSTNKLEGEIPNGGHFRNFTAKSFSHNLALCGYIRFEVEACSKDDGGSRKVNKVARLIKFMAPSLTLLLIAVIVILIFIRRQKQEKIAIPADVIEWRRISYIELERGTSCFSESNLLGRGSFGSVFEATLSDGLKVAVKVFNQQLQRAARSFDTETEILSQIRHRNLVGIIGCCSNTEFKALILTYMPNGSLEKMLYSSSNDCLDLMQRLKIAIDVAAALEYLHHGYNTFPIVHCDVKPSNVLLDEDMVAHLADFGIAKIFEGGEAFIQTQTLATIGYAAPEYGMEGKVSTNGDVYSFGIMLLEIFTGKKPTDDMFDEEMSLNEWVSEALQRNAATEIVSLTLLSREDRHFSAKEQCVSSIFELAMRCVAVSAPERIIMIDAAATLRKIKATLVAATERAGRRCPR